MEYVPHSVGVPEFPIIFSLYSLLMVTFQRDDSQFLEKGKKKNRRNANLDNTKKKLILSPFTPVFDSVSLAQLPSPEPGT